MEPLLKPCKICRNLTSNKTGYCEKHEPQYLEDKAKRDLLYNQRRGSPSKRGYDHAWTKCRKIYLMKHPLCEQCAKSGIIMPAREVHHILAINEGGAILDETNLMALCRSCHQKITEEQLRARRQKQFS